MKKYLGQVLCFFMAVLLLVLTGPKGAASDSNSLYLELINYPEIVTQLGDNRTGHELKAWKLTEGYDVSSQDVLSDLRGLTEEELNKRFATSSHPLTFHGDRLEVSGFATGSYYIRRVLGTPSVSYRTELAFEIKDGSPAPIIAPKKIDEPRSRLRLIKTDPSGKPLAQVGFRLYSLDSSGKEQSVPLVAGYRYNIKGEKDKVLYTDKSGVIDILDLPYGRYRFVEVEPLPGYRLGKGQVEATLDSDQLVSLTLVNEKIPVGNARFIKVDSSNKKGLAGASFRVLQSKNGQYQPVIQDGKELVLTSDANGHFTAENLEYGEYFLREIQPPSGYSQLGSSVSFRVDSSDSVHQITAIENKKRPRIEVPNTGDLVLYVLMLLAALLFGSGWYLSKKPKSP